jgi:uncharacterized protein YlzI (FlbEa/FlbD family)
MSKVFHPCSLCNAHASFYKDPEQSIREAVALEIEQEVETIVKTIEQTIQLMNQKIYTLLEEDGVNNLDKIKELTRSIQRIKRAR